jgi:hypothetical protein
MRSSVALTDAAEGHRALVFDQHHVEVSALLLE